MTVGEEIPPRYATEEQARVALFQPLYGTGLPRRVGPPAARNTRPVSSARAVGETAHRSAIAMPPLVHCDHTQRMRRSVLLKYSDLYFGGPLPPHSSHEAQKQDRRTKLLRCTWMSRNYPLIVLLLSAVMSLNVSPELNSRATRKQSKNSTLIMRRNGTWPQEPRCCLDSGAVRALCAVCKLMHKVLNQRGDCLSSICDNRCRKNLD